MSARAVCAGSRALARDYTAALGLGEARATGSPLLPEAGSSFRIRQSPRSASVGYMRVRILNRSTAGIRLLYAVEFILAITLVLLAVFRY